MPSGTKASFTECRVTLDGNLSGSSGLHARAGVGRLEGTTRSLGSTVLCEWCAKPVQIESIQRRDGSMQLDWVQQLILVTFVLMHFGFMLDFLFATKRVSKQLEDLKGIVNNINDQCGAVSQQTDS